MRVGILGGGQWGQALARLALAAGNEPLIAYRDRKDKPPHLLASTSDAPSVSEACDLLIVATGAAEVRQAIRLAQPGPGNRVVLAGRGIEPGTGEWLSDVVQQESDVVRVGALAGPAPVQEILNGGLCAGSIASPYAEVRRLVIGALHSKRYRVYETDDLVGTEIAGAGVPVLAATIGLAENLGGSGVGMHAMVITRGLAEYARLARGMGGSGDPVHGLAGMGDLVSSQGRPGHANYEVGKELATAKRDKRKKPPRLLATAQAVLERARRHGVDMPMTEAMVAVFDGADPFEAVGALMQRRARWEHR